MGTMLVFLKIPLSVKNYCLIKKFICAEKMLLSQCAATIFGQYQHVEMGNTTMLGQYYCVCNVGLFNMTLHCVIYVF